MRSFNILSSLNIPIHAFIWDEILIAMVSKFPSIACSVMYFVECITNTFIIKDMILDDMLPGCRFIEKSQSSDTIKNKQRRFLLYWWSTNIVLICGRHNHCQFPFCLIEKIIFVYPNEACIPCIGHIELPTKQVKKAE